MYLLLKLGQICGNIDFRFSPPLALANLSDDVVWLNSRYTIDDIGRTVCGRLRRQAPAHPSSQRLLRRSGFVVPCQIDEQLNALNTCHEYPVAQHGPQTPTSYRAAC